jgi:uncharacterized protein YlxW (UPF0749 family)
MLDHTANCSEQGGLMRDEMQSTAPRQRPGRMPERPPVAGLSQPANLADLLERVLDKGIVIAGDITICLGTIELLTIKIRLLIASVDKAQEIGINWWESDPALSSQVRSLRDERDDLRARVSQLEARLAQRDPAIEQASEEGG